MRRSERKVGEKRVLPGESDKNGVPVMFLAVHIPFSISVGMLHSDEHKGPLIAFSSGFADATFTTL